MKTQQRVTHWRGYDPHLENVDRLQSVCRPWWQQVRSAGEHPAEYTTHDWHVIEDQGSTPSCGGQSLSNVLECAYHVASGGKVVQLSRWFAWLEAQREDGGRLSPNRGVSIEACANVAVQLGVPLESLCPFLGDDWGDEISEAAYADAFSYRVRGKYWLDSYEAVRDFLWSGAGAVQFGVPWEFRRNAWHAVAVTGWYANGDLDGENSWGEDEGDRGHFRWTPRTVEKYFNTRGVVAVGLSDMVTPRLRDWGWNKDFLV